MRAPARAQDLILAQRVKGYRAGDLERRYPRLAIEEAYFVNYGFLPRATLTLLHPRADPFGWNARMQKRAGEVLAFVRERGDTHSKHVQAQFNFGRVQRWNAGLSASTHLLEGLQHSGKLRVARREAGTRIYQATESPLQDATAEARVRARRKVAGYGREALRAAARGQLRLSEPTAAPRRAGHRRRDAAGPG